MSRIKASEDLKKLTLLYVEDEDSIRDTFQMMIGRYFKKIFVANNGDEGLKIFKNNQIDIIISDIKMPIMTGLEMAKEIKKIDYEVPIIFTTAFGDNEYLREAIEIGIDGYIVKPIDRNKVIERLNIIAKSIIAKKEIEQYIQLIEILFDYQKNGVLLLDKEFNIKIYNKTLSEMLKQANIKEPKTIEDMVSFCTDENGIKITREYMLNFLNGKFICKSSKTDKFFEVNIDSIDNYILVNINDITEYKLKAEEMQEDAMIDSLTGVYNRKKLEVLKSKLLNKEVCLILFDIDNFKQINDTYGHLKGDEVLKILAKNIKNSLRSMDIIIRWGGEEFLVFLDGVKNIDIAKQLAEKLRFVVNDIDIDDIGKFSCSFGVSCGLIQNKENIEEILEKADEALYKAKRNGKNRVEII